MGLMRINVPAVNISSRQGHQREEMITLSRECIHDI